MAPDFIIEVPDVIWGDSRV
jgi:hypothetical protein